jgi:hypothetical protein
MHKKTIKLMDDIFEFCKNKKKSKEIADYFKINYNTLRANYLKKMLRVGRLKKLEKKYYQSVTGFREVTADQWKEMGLPEEISYMSFGTNKKDDN